MRASKHTRLDRTAAAAHGDRTHPHRSGVTVVGFHARRLPPGKRVPALDHGTALAQRSDAHAELADRAFSLAVVPVAPVAVIGYMTSWRSSSLAAIFLVFGTTERFSFATPVGREAAERAELLVDCGSHWSVLAYCGRRC